MTLKLFGFGNKSVWTSLLLGVKPKYGSATDMRLLACVLSFQELKSPDINMQFITNMKIRCSWTDSIADVGV